MTNSVSIAHKISVVLVLLLVLLAVFPGLVTTHSYEAQDREAIAAPPSASFPLGTDELGRDRLSRLLFGIRVSLLLAPASALLSSVLAAAIGGAAGYYGGLFDRIANATIDLFLSIPWLFLLLAVRALLPLNTPAFTSVLITFLLLGCLGWANPARMVRAATRAAVGADYALHAQASGISGTRLFWRHILPNVRSVLIAQFWIAVPVYILSEANLSLLGLGVSEPATSLGGLLRELENYSLISEHPAVLAPAVVLIALVTCLQMLMQSQERAVC